MGYKQLIINPGSTSTKLALYDGTEKVVQENIEHDAAQLHQFESIAEQVPFRLQIIRDFMARSSIRDTELSAVMGRGGLVFGLKTGGYEVNDDLCQALVSDKLSQAHASNLGGLLAREVARPLGIPAYIYDAVTGGELSDVAKITGIPDIERRSFCHVLNSHAMAIRYAQENGLDYNKLNLIVAHLGGGISASVHAHGQIIDSVGDDDGQFSPERSGCVPSLELIRLCYSGEYTKAEMMKKSAARAVSLPCSARATAESLKSASRTVTGTQIWSFRRRHTRLPRPSAFCPSSSRETATPSFLPAAWPAPGCSRTVSRNTSASSHP